MRCGFKSNGCAFALSLLLASCGGEPEVISAGPADPDAGKLAVAKPVKLPPAIAASRTYRCRDNSVLQADFYTDNSVRVRAGAESRQVVLVSPDGSAPFAGEGHSLSANAKQVTYKHPTKGALACKA